MPPYEFTSNDVLRQQADVLLQQLNYAMWACEQMAKQSGVSVYELKLPSGDLIFAKLLAAKASTMHTIALLKETP